MTVYYVWDDREASVVIDAFARREGVAIEGMRRSARTIVKLLEMERDAPVASVMMGGPVSAYEMGAEAGCFASYVPAGIEAYLPEMEDPEHRWHGIAAGVIGFGTDPDAGVEPPRSWRELLDPRYAGRIIYGDPTTSGTGYVMLSALIGLWGDDEAYGYLTALDDNVAWYTEGGAMAAHLARLGIGGVAIAFLHDLAGTTPRAGDRRLIITVPEEGTGWEISGCALVAGAPNPDLGRRLIDFLLTPEAQELLWREAGMPMYPAHPDALPPPEVPPFDGFRRVPLDWPTMGRAWDDRAERWYREVGSRREDRR